MGNMQKYSNWLIYSGFKNKNLVSTCFKQYKKNKKRQLNSYEHGRLSDLRNWNDSFFFQNSLQYITWWTRCIKNKSWKQVDLILKCTHINYSKKTLTFIDETENEYVLTLKVTPNKIEKNVIKLRCVTVNHKEKGASIIKLSKLSSCLIVPNYFYDARRFDKMLSGSKSMSKNQQKLSKNFTFLKGYNLKNQEKKSNNVAVVKNTMNDKKVLSVGQLQTIYNNASKHINERFVVKGYIMGFADTDPQNVIKKLEKHSKKVVDLKHKGGKGKEYQALYSLVVMLQDKKMKKGQYLNVYITTEHGDNHLFESWDILPRSKDMKAWSKISNKRLNEFEGQLKKLTNPKYTVHFGV